ncbi:MAG: hypothetical protein AAF297_08540 [Planctomycetota bacterium]
MADAGTQVDRGTTSPKHLLEETIGFLRTLDASYGGRPMSRDAIAEALGHSTTSSAAGIKIGSLTHFGLLRRSGNVYEVSNLGQDVLNPKDEREVVRAIVRAAKQPSLYRRLFADFANKALPQMFENVLLRDYGVARANTRDVAKKFRATAEFAGLLQNGVLATEPLLPDAASEDDESEQETDELSFDGGDTRLPRDISDVASPPAQPDVRGENAYAIPLSRGRKASLSIPRPIDDRDINRIVQWLDLMQDVLTEDWREDNEHSDE